MNVTFLSYHAEADKGGQINLLRLLRALAGRTSRCAVVVPAEGSMSDRARALGATTHAIALEHPSLVSKKRWPAVLLAVARLRRLLRRTSTRVLYVDGQDHVWPAWLASRGLAVRVLWHAQTSFPHPFDEKSVDRVDAVVGCSQPVTRRLAGLGGRARVRCIPNAVDTERFTPGDPAPGRSAAGAAPDELGILYVGELGTHKGIFDLVCALPAVIERHPSARLWIAGRGDAGQQRALREVAERAGVDDRLRWLGYRDDVVALLRAASAFVLPSHAEGLSLALLEAMAAGCPVVASDIAGNRAVIDHDATGLLAPVEQPLALAAAIGRVLDDPAAAHARGRAARARAVADHGLDGYISAFCRLFEELAA